MKTKLLTVLLLLSIFSSLGFTAPAYVDCKNPELDEWLDLFGITQSITPLKVILKTQPASFSDLIAGGNIFQRHYPRNLSLQSFISAPVLSVPLRC